MNIKLSPESIRVRVSSAEAEILRRESELVQQVPLLDGALTLVLVLSSDQESAVLFTNIAGVMRTSLREAQFLDLLSAKPSRESAIVIDLPAIDGSTLKFAFEIDLFSTKRKAGEVR